MPVIANPGSGGASFASDTIAGIDFPKNKLSYGVDGVAIDVTPANGLPVSVASLPLPLGAATEATLAAIAASIQTHDTPSSASPAGQLILAVRRDAATPQINLDGDYAYLVVNQGGHLKVAGAPAQFPAATGAITAVAQTVSADVTQASNVMLYVTGVFTGHNSIFEGSIDNGVTWFGLQAVRSNANTIETTTGVIAAPPVYAWEASVNALTNFRIRATAHVSGTANWRIALGSYATEPIPAAQVSATQPVSGTVTAAVTAGTVNPVVPATSYILNSLATTNIALIITGTSGLQAFYATNTGATVAFVKLYNKATAPVLATDVPAMILTVPAAVSGLPGVCTLPIGFSGFRFVLGLGIAITGAVGDTDATAIAAGQVKVMLSRTV